LAFFFLSGIIIISIILAVLNPYEFT